MKNLVSNFVYLGLLFATFNSSPTLAGTAACVPDLATLSFNQKLESVDVPFGLDTTIDELGSLMADLTQADPHSSHWPLLRRIVIDKSLALEGILAEANYSEEQKLAIKIRLTSQFETKAELAETENSQSLASENQDRGEEFSTLSEKALSKIRVRNAIFDTETDEIIFLKKFCRINGHCRLAEYSTEGHSILKGKSDWGNFKALSNSTDGRYVATSSNRSVTIYDRVTGKTIFRKSSFNGNQHNILFGDMARALSTITVDSPIKIAFDPTNRFAFVASPMSIPQTLLLFFPDFRFDFVDVVDLSSGLVVKSFASEPLDKLSVSPSGQYLVASVRDVPSILISKLLLPFKSLFSNSRVKFWKIDDILGKKPLGLYLHPNQLIRATIRLGRDAINLVDGSIKPLLKPHFSKRGFRDLSLSSDEKIGIFISDRRGEIEIYNFIDNKVLKDLKVHRSDVIRWSPNGATVFLPGETVGHFKIVDAVNFDTRAEIQAPAGMTYLDAQWIPKTDQIMLLRSDNEVEMRKSDLSIVEELPYTKKQKSRFALDLPPKKGRLAISPSGKYFFTHIGSELRTFRMPNTAAP